MTTPETAPCWLCGGQGGWEDDRARQSVVCPLCSPPGGANAVPRGSWPERLTGYDYLEARWFGSLFPAAPTMIVIHRPARLVTVAQYMHDPGDGRRVSTHYAPRDEGGEYVQCVSLHRQSWGQGGSCWEGNCHLNQVAISIEGMVPMCRPWPLRSWQTDRTRELLVRLYQELPSVTTIIGHVDGDGSRRSDPGTDFPWKQLVGDLGWRCPHL